MNVTLGESYRWSENFGKVFDVEFEGYYAIVRLNGREERHPAAYIEKAIKSGMLIVKENRHEDSRGKGSN